MSSLERVSKSTYLLGSDSGNSLKEQFENFSLSRTSKARGSSEPNEVKTWLCPASALLHWDWDKLVLNMGLSKETRYVDLTWAAVVKMIKEKIIYYLLL